MSDSRTNPAKVCPNCGAEVANEHVLCIACGYHFGLGRCIGNIGDQNPGSPPRETPEGKRDERSSVGRGAKVVAAAIAILVVLLGIYAVTRRGSSGGQTENGEQPGSSPVASVPPSRPDPRAVAAAVARLGEASPEQLGDLIAELAPADRDAAVANFLDSSLGKQRGPSDELVAVLAACGTAADSVGGKLEERLLHLVPEAPGDWAPGWGRVFALLPEGKREKVGLALGHRLLSGGAPWSIWSEWAPLLADLGTDERGEPLLGASLPERQALEQLPMSIVPLRFEGKPCLGVVIGRQEEVSVLTQPVEVSRRSASVSEADWQAATGNTPDEAWVGATCSFDVGNATAKEQRGTTC